MTRSFSTASWRRVGVAALLLVTCVRVFAGVEGIELHAHAGNADVAAFEVASEHSHGASHGGVDPTQPHFHCHTGCAHAAMVSPAAPAMVPTALVALTTATASASPTRPVFAHFRPPRA